ncbi:MAG: DEAD/DEAH box helicase [Marinifilaceae bacterium]
MKFTDFGFEPQLDEGLEAMGFSEATPVQESAIPLILKNKDILVSAQTGTGKTAAFLLPVLNNILKNKLKGVSTLILVPTRELAIQIDQQVQGLGYFLNISSVPVFGGGEGAAWDTQKNAFKRGVDIVVATPGRLMAHMELGYVDFSHVNHLVLDEADRMLDMGFIADIKAIAAKLPKKRQSLLFSATMPDRIKKFADELQTDAERINLATSKPAEGVLQAAYLVEEKDKYDLIGSLLHKKDLQSVIVFASAKVKVNTIVKTLKKMKMNVEGIHSDLDQKQREEVLLGFRNRKVNILVATDIISRGIDIDHIDLVVNFDVPNDPEDYVHRVGRTARAKSEGVAITFINKESKEQYNFKRIEDLIEEEVFKIPLPVEIGKSPGYNPSAKPPKTSFKKKFFKRK